jgi:EmrB/QacA subfamily drug resistance transporter
MNVVFATVLVAMLLSALDQTIVSTALPTIVSDLGGGHLSWVVSAYLLADTIATVLAGRLSDQFGRKRILQISAAVFIVSSAMCGFAPNMTWLIAWRGIQGLGAGGLGVTASAVIADVIPLRDRARYQGALGAVFGVALVLGPLLGGFFTDDLSWRWVFLINLPLGIVMMVLAARNIPSVTVSQHPTIDYSGIAFVTVGASALTLALSWGGTEYAWSSLTIIGLFVAAAIAFAVFVRIESRAAEPMLPLHLFRNPVFTVSVVLAMIVGCVMLGALTFLPTYSQYVLGISPTASGVRTLPLVVGLLATSMWSGSVVAKTGRYKPFPIAGFVLMGVGLWLFSRLTPTTGYPTLAIDMLVFGAGIGLSMQVLTIIVQNAVSFRDLGVATSGVGFFRTLGSSFGTAVFGTLFTAALTPRLTNAIIASHGVPASAAQSPEKLHTYSAHQIAPILSAYSHSLDNLFLAVVPVAALGLVVALFLKQLPLRETSKAGASDVGEGFGAPANADHVAQLEQAIARVLRAAGPDDFRTIATAAGTSLDAATAALLGKRALRGRLGLEAEPLSRDEQAEAARLRDAGRDWLFTKLSDWDAEHDPDFRAALHHIALQMAA